MIALIQRVTEASVTIEGQISAYIGAGMLTLIGIEKSDTHKNVAELAERILSYRLFSDEQGKMNLDVRASGGGVLLVPQFTLVADTHKGRRPGFSSAAPPAQACELFSALVSVVSTESLPVGQGTFGADMKVSLVNDGPVTFWLQTRQSD
ncbi:D-aminoacyl-tRNA deacylase [Granulosicoccus antarcticus]|uniref:D-aminoacyl-tRNA deacylase n=1 Tax=Granulosicoccus antarcticus IMCC3135 TaxID=1192854 RepID=A0A2Z2NYS6_9GAMM|nr:D-aminoacyl-tRNA deacylase [Granulosicoccus antarcticus]ASJ76479.1 D-aminoacyl-tRNA deacylase [Granulosicoccus antarcticus IMCC3135]